MKSAHQIASDIVDAWSYSANVKSSDKVVLIGMIAESLQNDDECVCKGNWRAIVKETEPLIGKFYRNNDDVFRLLGVLHGDDDYYYVMKGGEQGLRMLSCVGSIEGHGFVVCGNEETK